MDIELIALSPDGRYRVQTKPWEAGNTHWVTPPVIVDTEDGACLFAFQDPCWSVDRATWLSDTHVELLLRKYPGRLTGAGLTVTIDCACRVATYGDGIKVETPGLEAALYALLVGRD